MTSAAALEVWNETELRGELLRIANSGTAGNGEEFYAKAWALITRLRAGCSPKYYLGRVRAECCHPKWARPKPVVSQPPKTGPLCHWGQTERCIGLACIHYRMAQAMCVKDAKLFTRVLGEKAGMEVAQCAMKTLQS